MSKHRYDLVSMNDRHRLLLNGRDFLTLIRRKSFVSLIYYFFRQSWPTSQEAKVFELMLKIAIDHGPETPSAVATIAAARSGGSLSESAAAGISALTEVHGGAIEPCMELLYRRAPAKSLASKLFRQHQKVPGAGHRVYKITDPRAQLLLSAMKKSVAARKYGRRLEEIIAVYCNLAGKPVFPINIDGAMAVVLCSLKFTPSAGRAVFIAARTNGLLGHALAASAALN